MARKTNSSKSKRRNKSGRRKDYTRSTALSLRTKEAVALDEQQRFEIQTSRLKVREAQIRRSQEKQQAALDAKHGDKS